MPHSRKTKIAAFIIIVILIAGAIAAALFLLTEMKASTSTEGPTKPAENNTSKSVPELSVDIVMTNLDHPWDVAFLPGGEMLVNERSGRLLMDHRGETHTIHTFEDVRSRGEGGLMGLAVDTQFKENGFIYTCYASTASDVRLVRWKLDENAMQLTDKQPIITGMPLNQSGRHSGCRVRMDSENVLWIGTGDAAIGTHPQNPESLGGKILRVERDGTPAKGNLGSPFDARIFSYGHRNTQGIALFKKPKNGSAGFSVEHGSSVDDEVNKLVRGNFGWNPVPFYNERVAMTDSKKYPDAVKAVWSSGNPTIAPSGATLLSGSKWKAWDGALAMAVLKDQHLRVQTYDDNGKLLKDDGRFKGDFGRLRSAVQGPDGNLYLSTDNGEDDRIIKVIPH